MTNKHGRSPLVVVSPILAAITSSICSHALDKPQARTVVGIRYKHHVSIHATRLKVGAK